MTPREKACKYTKLFLHRTLLRKIPQQFINLSTQRQKKAPYGCAGVTNCVNVV